MGNKLFTAQAFPLRAGWDNWLGVWVVDNKKKEEG